MFTRRALIIFLFALVLGVPALGFAEMKKEYYPSGKLEYEFSYGNGEIEGISKGYYENGNLAIEGNYKNGMEEGLMKTYYMNGAIQCIDTYRKGRGLTGKPTMRKVN